MLLVEMSRPVPLHEFLLLHSEALHFSDIRACYLNDCGGPQTVRRGLGSREVLRQY